MGAHGDVVDDTKCDTKCGAKNKRGGRCGREAGWGTDHLGVGPCAQHLGNTRAHQLAGAVQLARRQAAVMGQPLDIDPGTALMQCIQIAAGEVQYASDQIADLEIGDTLVVDQTTKTRPLSYGKEGESSTVTVEEITVSSQVNLHAWIRVRHEAMDRLVSYSKIAITAGIAERYVRIAEQQGQLFAGAVHGILADLGLANHPEAPAVVRRHLTRIANMGARQLPAT